MEVTSYHPPFPLFNNHLQTIFPALFRWVRLPRFRRERITTSDDDFLDLDWLCQGSKKLVIHSHGLEGNSMRAYMKGMAKAFFSQGYDALTWNYRGCGEEMNHKLRFYHSGASDDLETVVRHSIQKGYDSIYLIGFSLGGNLTLKFIGEKSSRMPPEVKGCVVFSVPLHLHSSCLKLSEPGNRLYALRFLRSLKKKVISKSRVMKGIDIKGIERIDSLKAFDDRYTGPLHGFKDAITYYHACSAIHFLEDIHVPTLIVNAKNDPFLSDDCFPHPANLKIFIDYPEHGGHVGFTLFDQNGLYWSELRALQFINALN